MKKNWLSQIIKSQGSFKATLPIKARKKSLSGSNPLTRKKATLKETLKKY